MRIVNIAKDFTEFPSGRYQENGTTSGEEFRKKFLVPAAIGGNETTIQLDGTIGYGSSFLEEAFGGLVRETGLTAVRVLELFKLETENTVLREEIIDYIKAASDRSSRGGK